MAVQLEQIPSDVGSAKPPPPSFLQRWGVYILLGIGAWMLAVSSSILWHFLHTEPILPPTATTSAFKDNMDAFKAVHDQWRESFTFVFDLMITKTMLPLFTLILGYLFGRGKR